MMGGSRERLLIQISCFLIQVLGQESFWVGLRGSRGLLEKRISDPLRTLFRSHTGPFAKLVGT